MAPRSSYFNSHDSFQIWITKSGVQGAMPINATNIPATSFSKAPSELLQDLEAIRHSHLVFSHPFPWFRNLQPLVNSRRSVPWIWPFHDGEPNQSDLPQFVFQRSTAWWGWSSCYRLLHVHPVV